MPLAEWICIRPGAPTPTPFFFPDLSSTAAARPSFPAVAHMSHHADSSGGARARSRVQDCRSSRNHSIGLDPVGELSSFPLVLARTVVWLGWWRGGRRMKVKTTVVLISSVQGTRWVVCCVSEIWVRVLMWFWFCSMPRIVDFIISTRSISRCWRMPASLFFDRWTGQTRSTK
jgi:hypothetical protein